MTTYHPNPEFIENVPEATRKRWSDALRKAEADPRIWQAWGCMLDITEQGRGMCCLMVGHEAFGGTDDTRDDLEPLDESPLTRAFGHRDPELAKPLRNKRTRASGLNDDAELTFTQIADLIDGKAVAV